MTNPATQGASLEQRIKLLEDRAEIDQLISRLGQILDTRDTDALESVSTPEFAAIMTQGLNYMKTLWHDTQHIMSDRWIEIDGDKATVKANLLGTNIGAPLAGSAPDNFQAEGRDKFEVAGRYVYALDRTADGWRISNTDLVYLWTVGAMPAPKS